MTRNRGWLLGDLAVVALCTVAFCSAAHAQCDGDTNNDGAVNVTDLTAVILAWGTNNPAADVNNDNIVNVGDLTMVVLNWGPCPAGCDSPAGAPANDCCGQATVVQGLDALFDSVTLAFNTTNAGTDGPNDLSNPCQSASNDSQIWKDLWYRVSIPAGLDAGSHLIVSNCLQAQFDSKIVAYASTNCADLVAQTVDCNEDCSQDPTFATSTLNIEVTPGTTYTIRLGGFSNAGNGSDAQFGAGQVSFTLSPAVAPPINDNCVNAIPVSEGVTPFDTTGATTDGLAHAGCQFDGQTYNDIWYEFVAPETGILTVATCNSADYDTDLAVYDNSPAAPCPPGNAQLLGCDDDGAGCSGFTSRVTNIGVNQGDNVLIRVGGWSADDFGPGSLVIDVGGVVNDICELATNIALGQSITQGLCPAEADPGLPDCDFGVPINEGVWFICTGDGTTYTASLCGTADFNWDTRLSIYCTTAGDSDCDSLFCDPVIFFTAEDNTCGFSFLNEDRSFCTADGRTYLIYVHGAFGCGGFTLSLTSNNVPCAAPTCEPPTGACCSGGNCLGNQLESVCTGAGGVWVENAECGEVDCPANDECEDALPISVGCHDVDNTLSTTSPENELPASCEKGFGLGIKRDLWYEYTPTQNGTVTFTTCTNLVPCGEANWDTRMAAYEADSCGKLAFIACNDDGLVNNQACPVFTSHLEVEVTANVPILLRLGSYDDLDGDDNDGINGGSGQGVLEVSFTP